MKKKLTVIFISMTALLLCCLSFGACGGNHGAIIKDGTIVEPDKTIYILRTVGVFSSCRVDAVRVEYRNADVADVVVLYCIDGVHICTMPDRSYKYLVFTGSDDYVWLPAAYENGLITRDDLLAIAAAEKPYDTLYDKNVTGPIVPPVPPPR